MPTTSHAKCRRCGGNRHKSARMNLCRDCWLNLKPEIREQWEHVKNRRRQRRLARLRPSQIEREMMMTVEEEVSELLAEQNNGLAKPEVPPIGTPERAAYMRSFIGEHNLSANAKADILKAYSDGLAPVDAIKNTFGISNGRLNLLLQTSKTPLRGRTGSRLPAGRFEQVNGHTVWVPSEEPVQEPQPEPAPEPEAPAAAPEKPKRNRRLSAEQEDEVARLYDDPSVLFEEIEKAYAISPHVVMRIVQEHGLVLRSKRPGYKPAGRATKPAVAVAEPALEAVPKEPVPAFAPAPEPQVAAPVQDLPLALKAVPRGDEHAWAVYYVVRRVEVVAATSIDDALRRVREHLGQDIDIVQVHRT